jgi:Holliday junction resolvasome RuvABC endonuclease subunit
MTLLSIDPGTEQSGWVVLDDDNRIVSSGVNLNTDVLTAVREYEDVAIEMIASYGMPVGREVFETCVWIGRYIEAASVPDDVVRVTRNEVKNHLCGSSKAKDPNVRQALIDLFGPPGKKSAPGPTFGVTSHAWAALGVAATALKLERKDTTT